MDPNTTTTRIVVIGGGYTGLMSAIRVARRTRRLGAEVTLINPTSRFTERLRMHQIATGQELFDHQIPDLLAGTGVRFVQGWVTAIDLDRRAVRVTGGDEQWELGYERLIYAVGSIVDTGAVAGAPDAYTLDSPDAAGRLAHRLAELEAVGGTVAVAGNGLTGVEAAAEIAESRPGLHVVLLGRGQAGSMMGDRARAYLHTALDRLGVEVRNGVEITKVLPDAVELHGGELVPAGATLWTTGFTAPPLAGEAGLAVDGKGRVVVDRSLRSVSHPEVYAVGDSAAIQQNWGQIHGTCQSGMPSALHAADAIGRDLRGKPAKPFRFGYFHQPVSLGRRDAVIQFTRADDSPRRWYLTGRFAVRYKETVTSSPPLTYRLSTRVNVPARTLAPSRGGRGNR